MRKANNIFAATYGFLGILALGAVILGAWHQLFIALLCFGMSAVLLIENKRVKA